jgi:hypothetical protein
LAYPQNKLQTNADGSVTAAVVAGDVQGKVLGGGQSAIGGVGAWVLDSEGRPLRTAGGAIVTIVGGSAESEVTLSQRRGDDATFTFTCLDDAGAPIDLTGATVTFTVKPQSARVDKDDAAALIQKTATVTDAAGGVCEVTVSGSDTERAELFAQYDFDLQADAGPGKVRTLLVGTYRVLPDVTRRSSNNP